jgi:hypothetical protein
VSDRLRKQIAVERMQLSRLTQTYLSLIEKCKQAPPEFVEISALSAFLHAFYTGIENIFKRVVVELGESLPEGEFWHQKLLELMTIPTSHRPALISEEFRGKLRNYLDFRHVFRHAYTFDLQWPKMKELVMECPKTLHQLEDDLDKFLAALPKS